MNIARKVQLFSKLTCMVGVLMVAGCQTTTTQQNTQAALDKTRETSVEFSEVVERPSRSIEDIAALLDAASDTRPDELDRALEIANSEPTDSMRKSEAKMAAFYFKRSQARRKVGMAGGEIADAQKVVELGSKPDWIRYAGHSLQSAGQWQSAIELFERASKSARGQGHYYSSLFRA